MNYRSTFSAAIQTSGLYAAGFLVPLVGQMLALITPVPLILVYVRSGRKEGLAALGLSTALILLLVGWQAAAILLFSFGLMAAGIAEGMKQRMKAEQATLLGAFMPIAIIGAIIVFYFLRMGQSPIIAVEGYLRESIAAAAAVYTKMGLTETAAMVTSVTDSFVHYLARLMPSIIVATSVLQSATCYGISISLIMKKDGAVFEPDQPSFALWHAPDSWVWGLIAALSCIIVPDETFRFVGWNLAIIFAVVYLAQGSAIVDFYLRRAHIKPFVRGLMLALILAMPSIVFLIALGIVDIWADVRKVRGAVFKT